MAATMFYSIILAILAHLLPAMAQDASPSNSTLPVQLGTSTELSFGYYGSSSSDPIEYYVDFALDAGMSRRTPYDVLQKVFISSNVVLTTPYNINTLGNGSIAYISCDPDVYSGQNLKISDVIQATTKAITAQGAQGAIVLYSIYSNWCNYSQPASFNYTNVFILPEQSFARNLSASLSNTNVTHLGSIGPINVVDANGNPLGPPNSDNGNSSGTPQSTTVAMIILYSVTGIITLCFVGVIVSGALRARRHPERYGLLNLPGNAHQRRAKGIARAMLDTIPIVKFGEKEPRKLTTDVEQGTELPQIAKSEKSGMDSQKAMSVDSDDSVDQERARSSVTHSRDVDVDAKVDGATAEPATRENTQEHTPEETTSEESIPEENTTDDGLACSVCTEDFVKGQDLRVLPCDHRFHPECIDPWLLNVSGTCPLWEEANQNVPTETVLGETSDLSGQPGATPQQTPRFNGFLNRHRMRESTPAQRLRALRALRNHQAAINAAASLANANASGASRSNTASITDTPPRSNRVSRFFGRGNGSSTAVVPPTPTEQQDSSAQH